MLRATLAGAEAGSHFAFDRRQNEAVGRVERLVETVMTVQDEEGNGGLDGAADAVLCTFDCNYLPDKTVEINDHVVVFGQVVDIRHPGSDPTAVLEGGSAQTGLVYVNGHYVSVGAGVG